MTKAPRISVTLTPELRRWVEREAKRRTPPVTESRIVAEAVAEKQQRERKQ